MSTIDTLISYLRSSVSIQDKEGVINNDPNFLSMSDEELEDVLTIGLSGVDSEDSLNSISPENIQPTILRSQIELYHRLAVKTAPKYTITSSSGATLDKDQIFDHYYKLIQLTKEEYELFVYANGGNAKISIGDVLLDKKYFSERNYTKSKNPKIILSIDTVGLDYVELSWVFKKLGKLDEVNIYLSNSPIYDRYSDTKAIKEGATKVVSYKDLHKVCTRLIGLKSDTTYYVLIEVIELNGLKGYSEVSFKTDAPIDNVEASDD